VKTWVKIDDDLYGNAKVRDVPVAARWTYVASICYAGHYLTDGIIPGAALASLDGTPKIAAELVRAGLWEIAEKGWRVHDYEKHNRTKEKAEHRSTTNRDNGSKGLANRYAQSLQTPSEPLANRPADRALLSALSFASSDPQERVQKEERQIASKSLEARDRMLALDSKLPAKNQGDPDTREDFMQIVEDYTDDQIQKAIRNCRSKNLGSWPRAIRGELLLLFPPLASAAPAFKPIPGGFANPNNPYPMAEDWPDTMAPIPFDEAENARRKAAMKL
jgi:hypothetical protein